MANAGSSISNNRLRQSGPLGKLGLSLFFSVFLIAGSCVLYFLTIRQIIGIVQAKSWTETPCTILSSEVETSTSDDGDTYRPLITYEYPVNDRLVQSSRYDFSTGYSGGYEPKKRIVDQYPPGSKAVCYVNPSNPHESVLNRSFSWNTLIGLFGLLFLLPGLGGLYFIWKPQSVAVAKPNVYRAQSAFESLSTAGLELKSKATPLGKFLGYTFIALFWNGITGVFAYKVIESWMQGAPDGCTTIFILPFVAVGLMLIYAAAHQFLALFNPRPILHLIPARISPGDSFDVEWKFAGSASRFNKVYIRLKGAEEATYRRGTDTKIDRSIFEEIEILNATDAYRIKEGRTRIRVPENTMHSFESAHNKIVWSIHVSGDLPKWPDVDEEFEVTILPANSRFR